MINALHQQFGFGRQRLSMATSDSTVWSRHRLAKSISEPRERAAKLLMLAGAILVSTEAVGRVSTFKSVAPCWFTWTCRGTRWNSISELGSVHMAKSDQSPSTSCATRNGRGAYLGPVMRSWANWGRPLFCRGGTGGCSRSHRNIGTRFFNELFSGAQGLSADR